MDHVNVTVSDVVEVAVTVKILKPPEVVED
jgi:hypothetical protein